MTRRAIPSDVEAEAAVLSAMMLDAGALREARRLVAPDDFHATRHRAVAAALAALADRGVEVDPLTLCDELRARGALETAGGMDYVSALVDVVPTAANVAYHARIVRRTAEQRRLVATLETLADAAADAGADPAAVAREGVQALVGAATTQARAGFVAVRDALWPVLETIEARAKGERADQIVTGFPEFDHEPFEGIERGDLVTLVLVSGHGKTSLQLALARSAAKLGTTVGFVSAEMSQAALVQRLLVLETGIPLGRLRRGRLYDDDYPALARAAGVIGGLPLHISDAPLPTLADVAANARALKAAHPDLALLFVDYLQLLKGAEGDETTRALDHVANGMKALAKELGVAVVQSAQPDGKLVDRRPEHPMPRLADIRWTQAIREASDLVVCGYRPGLVSPGEDDRMILEAPKSRASGTVGCTLKWFGPAMAVWSPSQRPPYMHGVAA